MSLFEHCLVACGLDEEDAADFFGVEVGLIEAWEADPSIVPEPAWEMLSDLRTRIDEAAACAAEHISMAGYDPSKAEIDAFAINHGADRMPAGAAVVAGAMAFLRSKKSTEDPIEKAGPEGGYMLESAPRKLGDV